VHLDRHSQSKSASAVVPAPCEELGEKLVNSYYFRYGGYEGFFHSRKNEKCFQLSTHVAQDGVPQNSLVEVPNIAPRTLGTEDLYAPMIDLEKFCIETEQSEPKFTRQLDEAMLYHLHIPKVAGVSFAEDAKQAANTTSVECCADDFPDGARRIVLLKEPRSHVVSQFYFCSESVDAGPSMMHQLMPPSFEKWLDFWTTFKESGDAKANFQRGRPTTFNQPWCTSTLPFGCYNPISLQSHRLTCHFDTYDLSEDVPVEGALQKLHDIFFVGLAEAYQESLCVLHGLVRNELPEWCDVEDPGKWQHAEITHESHGTSHPEASDFPPDVIAKIDGLVTKDRILYQAGIDRFIRDVREVELRFQTRILSNEKLTILTNMHQVSLSASSPNAD